MSDSVAQKLFAALLIALGGLGSLFLVYSSEQGAQLRPSPPHASKQVNQ
jgi:hypothetical protein